MKKITLASLAALACFALSCQQGNGGEKKQSSSQAVPGKQPQEAKEGQIKPPPAPSPAKPPKK